MTKAVKRKTVKRKTVMTIAGFDPSGGAGIQADLRVFNDFKLRGLSAVTALTVQTGSEVMDVRHVSTLFLKKQISALTDEYTIDAVKIGMMAKNSTVKLVGRLLATGEFQNVVLDPVFYSSSKFPLLDDEGMDGIRKLMPFVSVVTPNLEEASLISARPVRTVKDMKEAALRIHAFGSPYVIIKGGHLKKSAVDILYDGKGFEYFEGVKLKVDRERFHGTGCLFSSAIAAGLAKGRSINKAVAEAKSYVMKVVESRK
jgi:hydroxymethylpyrimidine/phosphomethylpyrimidine kinase